MTDRDMYVSAISKLQLAGLVSPAEVNQALAKFDEVRRVSALAVKTDDRKREQALCDQNFKTGYQLGMMTGAVLAFLGVGAALAVRYWLS